MSSDFGDKNHTSSFSGTQDADAADFLLTNSKYHNSLLIVGDPNSDEVESIGVESSHLIAHSPVLREMLENQSTAESKIHIVDVSPATFKLMLRFVYGGKLPEMTTNEAAYLALCAQRYGIPRLVKKALKRLNPLSVEDVFSALVCVTCRPIDFPELRLKVKNIIQLETDKVIGNPHFTELDQDCLVFILKQNALNVSETELWQKIMVWAECQIVKNPNKTIRNCLSKILGHVRFLTFTPEEILGSVLSTEVLTPEEFMDLMLAVTRNMPLKSTTLCSIKEKRNCPCNPPQTGLGHNIIKEWTVLIPHHELVFVDSSCRSNFEIKATQSVVIESFTCMGNWFQYKSQWWYKGSYDYDCAVSVVRSANGCFISDDRINAYGEVLFDEDFTFPVILEGGEPLVILQGETCSFRVHFITAHPTFKLVKRETFGTREISIDTTTTTIISNGIQVKYKDYFHVIKIAYKLY